MKVSLIVAMDRNRGIGKNNDLMWHLPADMKFFKETTTGHVVLMGRKNFESIPERFRPLPNRLNVILTRNLDFKAQDCVVFHSVQEVIDWVSENQQDERTFFIIGGGEIYTAFLNAGIVAEMYITEVDAEFDADTFFPAVDLIDWKVENIVTNSMDDKNPFGFNIVRYTRN